MSYRDDAEMLYERALTLQKELDATQERLAERERELAKFRGDGLQFDIPDTSPGMRTLRELPPAEDLLSRLVDTFSPPVTSPVFDAPPFVPDDPMVVLHRTRVLQAAREHLERLPDKQLMIMAAIIEELAIEKPQADLVERLRVIGDEITQAYERKRRQRR